MEDSGVLYRPTYFEEKWMVSEWISCIHLYQFALRNWKKRQVTRHSAIAMSLYLFELFGTTDFLQRLVLNPKGSQDVVHLTFTEFFYIYPLLDALLNGDLLTDQARYLMGLICLNAGHALLHQISTFHVQEKGAFFRFDFASRYHLEIRVMN